MVATRSFFSFCIYFSFIVRHDFILFTTFYNKNAHSQIFGIDLTAENIESKYGGNPETIRNFSKGYNSWTTFSLLWGMFQGLTNKSAAFLKRDIAGNEAVHRAQAELKGPRRT